MAPKDKEAAAVQGRHRKDAAVSAVLSGDPDAWVSGFVSGIGAGQYERGVSAASRIALEKVASGELTQDRAKALLAQAAALDVVPPGPPAQG